MADRLPPPPDTTGHILPLGWMRLTGGRAADGWILSWDGALAYGWSPESGLLVLPRARDQLLRAEPSASGMVALCEGGWLGYWRFGESCWRWWRRLPIAAQAAFMAGQPNGDLMIQGGPGNRHVALYAVEDDGPRLLAEDLRSDAGAALCTWQDDKSGVLRVLTHEGLWLWTRKGEFLCRGAKFRNISRASGAVFTGPAVIVLEEERKRGARYCLKTKQWKRLHLAHIDGCEALWQAYERRDREAAARMRAALDLAVTGPAPQASIAVFDMLTADLVPIATVTSAGIRVAETTAVEPGHEGAERRFAAGPSHARILWEIWIDHERALPIAVEEILRADEMEDVERIVEALEASGDAQLVAKIVATLRGREPQRAPHWRPEGVRYLCRHLTPAGYAVALHARSDPDPAVAWFGAALPLEPQPSAKPMGELEQDQVELSRALVLLANHENIAVAEVALDTLESTRSPLAVEGIAALVESDDAVRRELALNALAEFGEQAADLVAAVELRAESDPCPSVRVAGVLALSRVGSRKRVLPTLLRLAHDAVEDVRVNAIMSACRGSADLDEDRLRDLGRVSWVVRAARDERTEAGGGGGADWGPAIEARFPHGVRPNEFRAMDDPDRRLVVALALRDVFEARSNWGCTTFSSDAAQSVLQFTRRMTEKGETLVDAAALGALSSQSPSPLALGQAALQALRKSPADGRDLVLMSLLLLERWQESLTPGPPPREAGEEPLHVQLRRLGGAHPVLCEIREHAWEWAKAPGLPGLVALFALHLGGHVAAEVELRRRLLAEPLDEAGFVVWAYLKGLGAADRPALVERLLARGDLPVGVRSVCEEAPSWS